jgi:hypothetical protein
VGPGFCLGLWGTRRYVKTNFRVDRLETILIATKSNPRSLGKGKPLQGDHPVWVFELMQEYGILISSWEGYIDPSPLDSCPSTRALGATRKAPVLDRFLESLQYNALEIAT